MLALPCGSDVLFWTGVRVGQVDEAWTVHGRSVVEGVDDLLFRLCPLLQKVLLPIPRNACAEVSFCVPL